MAGSKSHQGPECLEVAAVREVCLSSSASEAAECLQKQRLKIGSDGGQAAKIAPKCEQGQDCFTGPGQLSITSRSVGP